MIKRINKESHTYYFQFSIDGKLIQINLYNKENWESELVEAINLAYKEGRASKLKEIKDVLTK